MPNHRRTTSGPTPEEPGPEAAAVAGTGPETVAVDGVGVQVDSAAAGQETESTVAAANPAARSPLRTALGRARRAGTAFLPSPPRSGDGDARPEPPGRVPRPIRAGALIAGLVLVAGAFAVAGLHHSDDHRQRDANPANQLVGDPDNGDGGVVPGVVPAPLTSSATPSAPAPGGGGGGGGGGVPTGGANPGGNGGAGAPGAGGAGGAGGSGAGAPKPSSAPATKTTPTHAPGTHRIIGWQGLCIDVPNFHGVDGQRLQVAYCNGLAAQDWSFPGDGTIRIYGLCMDVAWGSTDNGAAIQLARCSGNPAQQFVLTAAGDLVNPQADKCVDVTGWGGDGTPLEQWSCSGGGNQKWHKS